MFPAPQNPAMQMAPGHVGPGTAPQGNPGNASAAMQDVRNAMQMLQKALPNIPMGTPLHEKILNTVKDLTKEMKQGEENPALQLQSLVQMMRSQQQQQPMAALGRMMQPQPGAPPAMPAPPQGALPAPPQEGQ